MLKERKAGERRSSVTNARVSGDTLSVAAVHRRGLGSYGRSEGQREAQTNSACSTHRNRIARMVEIIDLKRRMGTVVLGWGYKTRRTV